jgi:hypothetical protein
LFRLLRVLFEQRMPSAHNPCPKNGPWGTRSWLVEEFYGGIEDFGSQADSDTYGGSFDFFQETEEVFRGVGDGGDSQSGTIVDNGFVHLCDGYVEGVAQLVFQRTDDLSTILEGVSAFNIDFEDESGCWHRKRFDGEIGVCIDSAVLSPEDWWAQTE